MKHIIITLILFLPFSFIAIGLYFLLKYCLNHSEEYYVSNEEVEDEYMVDLDFNSYLYEMI